VSMRGFRRLRRAGERITVSSARERQLLAQAMADITCTCGRTFEGGTGAFTIHRDMGRCLPGDAFGQLVQLRDGRWSERWRHPEVRE
jgi:hypothetical protein